MLESVIDAIAGVGFAAVAVFGFNPNTAEPPFTVLQQLGGEVTIRQYQPRIVAETTAPDAARGDAFRRLAGYIFGGNGAGERMAMTAPVEIAPPAPGLTMRFFMPADRAMERLPSPRDASVRLVALPATTMAVRQFSGSTSAVEVARQTAALAAALPGSGWVATGPATTYLYNPPWTLPPFRRNEVAMPVSRQP